MPQVKINLSPYKDYVPLKELLRKSYADLVDQVVNFNASKVRKLAEQTDKEIQTTLQATTGLVNDDDDEEEERAVASSDSPTQANLSAIPILPTQVNNYEGIMIDNH